MKLSFDTVTVAVLLLSNTPAFAHPQPVTDIQLVSREEADQFDARDYSLFEGVKDLWKRKGGGGGGGKGGSSGGKGGDSSSGSTSSAPKGSTSSNTGGATKTGSGVRPAYGGGRYYGGGATQPYRSGGISPLGIVAFPLAFGALAFYPGIWLYGAYSYPYHNPYSFHNRTARANNTNSTTTPSHALQFFGLSARQEEGIEQTKNVTCLCAMYQECGCDDNGDTTFLDSIIGDGTYSSLNLSLVNVADINGTSTIILNGTLPNGTTASGGTDDASAAVRSVVEASGYWVMIALVGMTVYMV